MAVLPFEILKNSVIAVIIGFLLTFFFDTITELIKKISIVLKRILLIIKDFIFIFTYAIIFILILYYFSEGTFRGIYMLSMISGSLIYYIVFAKLLQKVVRVLIFPFNILLHFLYGIVIKIFIFFRHTIEKIEFRLYNNRRSS